MLLLSFFITLFISVICLILLYYCEFNYFSTFIFSYICSATFITILAPCVAFIFKSKKIRLLSCVQKNENTLYYREPPFYYSPVIITYLENLKLEINKDCFAELLFLYKKGYIQIQKSDNKYIIVKNNEFCNTSDELLKSQQFILSNINDSIDLNTFITIMKKNKNKLESLYEQDCCDLGYLNRFKDIFRNDKLEKFIKKLPFTYLVILGIFLQLPSEILNNINFFGILIFFLGIVGINIIPSMGIAFIVSLIFDRMVLLRTNKAKEDYAKWIAFKDFLNDYTLIKNYNLESINFLEDYLTYSVALGITKIDI